MSSDQYWDSYKSSLSPILFNSSSPINIPKRPVQLKDSILHNNSKEETKTTTLPIIKPYKFIEGVSYATIILNENTIVNAYFSEDRVWKDLLTNLPIDVVKLYDIKFYPLQPHYKPPETNVTDFIKAFSEEYKKD
jgi:hypothetical protein